MSIVFLQPHFLLSWIWNNFLHIYNIEFLVWLTPLFLLCLYNICLIFILIPSYIHLVLLKGILPLHPPPQLHIHLVVFPQCFVILFFHNGILLMPIFINLNHAHVWLLLSRHFILWLWGLLFLRWDLFFHHKDQGTGMWTNTGKEELQTEQLTFVWPGLLQTWEVLKQAQAMGRQDDRCPQTRVMVWEMFQPHLQHYYQNYCPERKLYSLVSKCHILLLVQWKQEYMRTCVISNQGITPGGQSSNNLLFLLDCWEAFISFINFDFRTWWRRK